MADNKQSFQAGHVAGKTEEKGHEVIDKVKDTGAGAGDKVKDAGAGAGTTTHQGGQKTSETGGGVVNTVKEKIGVNK